MIQSPTFRRFARNTFALAALVSAVMLTLQFGSMATSLSGDEQAAFAASAGTSPEGDVELTPASGQLSTTIALSPEPAPAFCPGDSVAGYRWQTFISEASNDPATFTYDAQGPVVPGGGVGITFPLVSSSGVNQVNRNTAADTGNGGQVTPIPGFDLSIYGALLVDGDYKIGFACTLAGETVSFWVAGIQISAGSFEASTTSTTSTSSTSSTTSTTTTTTTVAGGSTTTTVAGGTTTTTVAGATTTVAGGTSGATVSPSTPTPGGSYRVTFPDCSVGETITFSQSASTPSSVTDVCEAASPLSTGSVAGIRMPAQATTGTAIGSFTAAPTAAGSYTITMTGTVSAQRTVTFVIVGAATPVTGGNSNVNTGGTTSGTTTGTIPSTGSSTTSLIVWGALLLVFGRVAILLGRTPKVLTGT